jgi:hypothetical protein
MKQTLLLVIGLFLCSPAFAQSTQEKKAPATIAAKIAGKAAPLCRGTARRTNGAKTTNRGLGRPGSLPIFALHFFGGLANFVVQGAK